MKLDRNINADGRGKYALVKLRDIAKKGNWSSVSSDELHGTIDSLVEIGIIDYGDTPDTEFFVIRLKDKYAAPALIAYGAAASSDDHEWADEVFKLAVKAKNHPSKRKPD